MVVDRHSLFAESLEIAVEAKGYSVRLIPISRDLRPPSVLVAPILGAKPWVVLLELNLGSGGDGVRLVDPLARAGVAVVVITGVVDRARWGEALAHGARAVLPKSSTLVDVLATLRRVQQNLPVISQDERERLVGAWYQQSAKVLEWRSRLDQLTCREAEVLRHLMAGMQVRDIAEARVVSEATIRTQVRSILTKLDVKSQITAVGIAHRANWTFQDEQVGESLVQIDEPGPVSVPLGPNPA